MAEPLFEAEVQIRARLDNFERDLNKLERDVNSHVRGVEANLQRTATATEGFFKKALGAVSAGLIARELGQIIAASVRFGSEINDAAVRLGVSTQKLQEFRFAAVQAGAGVGELEAGLARLSRAMSEARDGNQNAVDAFREINRLLGRDVLANGAGVEKVFRDLALALERVSDPAEKVRISFELLGRNPKLLQLLNEGAEGFDRLTQAARETNAILSDQQIKILDDAGDAWDALALRIKVAMAGVVADVAQSVSETQQELAKLLDLKPSAVGNPAGTFRGLVDSGVIDLQRPVSQAVDQATSTAGGTPSETASEREARQKREAERGKAILRDISRQAEALAKADADRRRQLEEISNLEIQMLQTRGQFVEASEKELQSVRDRINAMEELTQAEKDRALAAVEATAPEIRRQAQEAEAQFERSKNKINDLVDDLTDDFADAFGDWLRTGEGSFKALALAFKETVSEFIIRELAKIAAKMAILGLVKLGTSLGVPGASSIPVPQFAAGGVVRKPTLGVIGESGPEAVIPLSQLAQLGLGASTSVTVVNATGEESRVQRSRSADGAEQIRVLVGNLLVEDFDRGGPVSKKFEQRFGVRRVGV